MEVKTFAELSKEVWEKIRRPCIAIYRRPAAVQQAEYLCKIYDADCYTGIFMQRDSLKEIKEDIRVNAPWLEYADRGAEDDPSLVCVYV